MRMFRNAAIVCRFEDTEANPLICGACLAGNMGLGKTVYVLAFLTVTIYGMAARMEALEKIQ